MNHLKWDNSLTIGQNNRLLNKTLKINPVIYTSIGDYVKEFVISSGLFGEEYDVSYKRSSVCISLKDQDTNICCIDVEHGPEYNVKAVNLYVDDKKKLHLKKFLDDARERHETFRKVKISSDTKKAEVIINLMKLTNMNDTELFTEIQKISPRIVFPKLDKLVLAKYFPEKLI